MDNMESNYQCNAEPYKCECAETIKMINLCLSTGASHCTIEEPNYWVCDANIKQHLKSQGYNVETRIDPYSDGYSTSPGWYEIDIPCSHEDKKDIPITSYNVKNTINSPECINRDISMCHVRYR